MIVLLITPRDHTAQTRRQVSFRALLVPNTGVPALHSIPPDPAAAPPFSGNTGGGA